MNAPLVWIAVPALLGLVLFSLQPRPRLAAALAGILAAVLALAAWQLPLGKVITAGAWSFTLDETLFVLGRRFTLTDEMRPLLTGIYALAAFWLVGAAAARRGYPAASLALTSVALMTAALAVEPFLYAALLLEMAALLCVPLLAPPGKPVGQGVLRFVTFQTLGMPFLLFTGWLLAGVEADPGNQTLVLRVSILLGLGFSFLLAVLPFHTWLPMLASEADAYAAAFVFLMLPVVVILFGLGFLERYSWLREAPMVYAALRTVGALMVAVMGLLAAFQQQLGRSMGYAVIGETGFALLALGTPGGLPIYFATLLPRALALAVWAMALQIIHEHTTDLSLRAVRGVAQKLPLAATCLALAHFSLAGLPLLGSFPPRLWLWSLLSGQFGWMVIVSLLGEAGLMVGGLRTLAAFVSGFDNWRPHLSEEPWRALLLATGVAALLAVGLFPAQFLAPLARVPEVFVRLSP